MWKLLPIVIFALAFAGLTEYYSVSRIEANGMKVYEKKANLYYYIMAIAMAVFVGLRTQYNDTGTYLGSYGNIKVSGSLFHSLFDGVQINFGNSFGFEILSRFLKYLHFSPQSFLMFFSLFTIFVYLWFIKKYSCDICFSIFCFITMGGYTFTMAAIRQCVALAFCLIGVDFVIRKKVISFIILTLIGLSIHQYAFVFFVVPLLTFVPWSNKTYAFLGIAILVAIFMKPLLTTISDFAISYKVGSYDENSFSGAGVNVFRVLVVWVPLVLSFVVKDKIINDRAHNIIVNLSMLNAVIMFLGIFGTANYFARLANYFLIFQTISLPYIFRYFDEQRRVFLMRGAIIGYSLYFCYANIFAAAGFDKTFNKTSLFVFLSNIFE